MVRAFKALVRGLLKPVLSPRVPVRWQRRLGSLIGLSLRGPAGAVYRERRWAGVPVLDIAPAVGTPTLGVLFLHGGGYVMGGFGSHRKLAATIGEAAGARVVVVTATHMHRLETSHPMIAGYGDVAPLLDGRGRLVIAGSALSTDGRNRV